ncbi:MAG: substrate-binding domain-containing protein [Methanolobus sp.]|nr:substrate-binding domain-containing protein [Methanolobus sp.]
MNFKKLFNNEAGVSPIVATLVLVVVAIAGAAAVGTILGSFSGDVSDQANSASVASSASTELLIAGSTTVQPVTDLVAKAYMAQNPGIRVTVQGGGSGSGVAGAAMGVIDIGQASKTVPQTELTEKGLTKYTVGGSAIAIIAHEGFAVDTITKDEITALYNATSSISGNTSTVTTVVQRADASGTEETFAKYATGNKDVDNAGADGSAAGVDFVASNGNAGVIASVASTPNAIGFADFGLAVKADGVIILDIIDGKLYEVDEKKVLAELKNMDGDNYPTGLTRPLNMLVKGEPTSVQKSFIDFMMAPGAMEYFEKVGYYSAVKIAA